MKNGIGVAAGLAVLAFAAVPAIAETTHRNASVDKLQATLPDTTCFYFTLSGVTEADPVVPSASWFAISKTQAYAADQYAMLLAAKVSGAPVWITTSGTTVCGYAGVRYVTLE